MNKRFQFAILFALGLMMTSCYYDDEIIIVEDDVVVEDVSYEFDIQPLWNQDCASCHNGTIPPDLRSGSSWSALQDGWVVPGDADNSTLYKSLIGVGAELMPPGNPWPSSRINLVRDWINQGALDN